MLSDRQFKFWLNRATREQKLDALLWGQRTIMKAQQLDFLMEIEQMARFTGLDARVAKISDLADSVKTAYDGVVAERDAARAELAAGDTTDQASIDALEEKLAVAEAKLVTLAAVAAGTPVVLPPDPSPPVEA